MTVWGEAQAQEYFTRAYDLVANITLGHSHSAPFFLGRGWFFEERSAPGEGRLPSIHQRNGGRTRAAALWV